MSDPRQFKELLDLVPWKHGLIDTHWCVICGNTAIPGELVCPICQVTGETCVMGAIELAEAIETPCRFKFLPTSIHETAAAKVGGVL